MQLYIINTIQSESIIKLKLLVKDLLGQGTDLGLLLIKAVVVLIIGRIIIRFANKFVRKLMDKEHIDPSVKTFVSSLVKILLYILLGISVIGTLGIQTTSFAALLASCGIAIGMALSGNLSNFAGGIIILMFKPFKVGDTISTANVDGTVEEIQIFHTILFTPENIKVYVPNGVLSSGYVKNFNVTKRRLEWIVRVEYGSDFDFVKKTILSILLEEPKILKEHEPLIELNQLAADSINIVARVWVNKADYGDVNFHINQRLYEKFNEVGIKFPYSQLTIRKG